MQKVRATLAAIGVALGVLALPAAAGAQEIVPRDVLLQWKAYDAFAKEAQSGVMRRPFTGRADAGSEPTTGEVEPLEVERAGGGQDAPSPVGVVVAALREAVGIG